MEVKKKNFLENLRLKTKLPNLKKPRNKPLSKQGRRLAHRRSISVPDLRLVPGEAPSSGHALVSAASDAVFFAISSGHSDTDSVASNSITDGPFFTDKMTDSASVTGLRVPTDYTPAALNRISAPAEMLYERTGYVINSGLEDKVPPEGLYAQVDKKGKANIPKFTFDPIPAPRSVITSSPRPDLVDRESLQGEDSLADRVCTSAVSAALLRASSLGEQMHPNVEKRPTSFEQRKAASDKGTPPRAKKAPANRTSLIIDTMGTPLESADGTSLDSACGSPSEEPVNMPWTTDSEELEREPTSPLLMRQFTIDDDLLQEAQCEENLEDIGEVSVCTGIYNHKDSQAILFLIIVCMHCRLWYLKVADVKEVTNSSIPVLM